MKTRLLRCLCLVAILLAVPGRAGGQVSPSPSLGFLARDDTGWLPPDTHGAVGPNHVVTAVNGGVRIQSRTGNPILSVALNTFLNRTDTVFDPKIYYDHFADRWLLIACANGGSPNSAVIVSGSLTADPGGAWNVQSYDADPSNTLWADYPSVGFNKDWVAVNMNMFAINGGFSNGRLYVMPRTALYAAGTVNATLFNDANGFTTVPAVTYDPTLASLYVLQEWLGNSGGRGYLRMLEITGSVNSPQLAEIGRPSTSQPWNYNSAPSGNLLPQTVNTAKINGGDSRMQHVVYRNGSIWATHNAYTGAGATLRSLVQWWQISPQAVTLQFGRIEDTNGTYHNCFPSIAVNRNSDVLVGYSRFSPGTYPSAAYSFRASGDAAGTMRAPSVFKMGESSYQKNDASGRNRWGDYSATITDPVDDTSFWTVQEYASTNNRWSTWWARVQPPSTNSILRFSTATNSVGEAAGTATITVSRAGYLRSAVTVSYATSNGSATAGSDYTATAGTLSFGDGEESRTFTIPITNDIAAEGDETINLTLSAPGAGAELGYPTTSVLTIADNDTAAPTVTVAAPDSSASELGDTGVFTFTRSGSTAVSLAATYSVSGTAAAADFTGLSGNVTFPAGVSTASVTVTPVDDTTVETTETVILTLSAGAGYTIGTPGSATINLLDNDQTAVVTVQASDASANESGDGGQFTIARTGDTASALVVNLTTAGTAAAGTDYQSLPATSTIPAGSASATVTVSPLDDLLVEGSETVVLSLAAGGGYVVGSPSSATVNLGDNDAATGNDLFSGRYSLASLNVNGQNTGATEEIGEPDHGGNAGGRSVWWTWTSPFNGNVTFATEGSNFDTLLAVYTGAAVGSLTLIGGDDDAGPNRTSRVTFTAVSGTTYQIAVDGFNGASGNIVLTRTQDPVQTSTFTITATDPSATEGGTDTGTFTIARTGSTTAAIAVGLSISGNAVNGSDYEILPNTFTLPAGAASASLVVTPLDDPQVEGSETVSVTLQNGLGYTVGAPSSATVTLADNDSTVGNDLFSNAAVMTGAVVLGDNTGTFKEPGEPNHAGAPGGTSVWWRWTATFTGTVTFHTEGSLFDTVLAVYTGTAVGALTPVASDNDSGAGNASLLSFAAVTGVTYHIAVDGVGGAFGSITLTRSGDPGPLPTITVAASDATAKEGSGDVGKFLITRTGPTTAGISVNVSFAGTATNGSDYALLTSPQVIPAGASSLQITVTPADDALSEGDETATMTIEPGGNYEIEGDAVPYVPGGRAIATVTITDNDLFTSNDAFAGRFVLAGSGFSTTGANLNFTKESGEPNHAGNAGGKSAWWTWTAPASGEFTITTDGSDFDTLLAVYTGTAVSSLALIAADDDAGAGVNSLVTFTAVAGTTYQIAVEGYASVSGSAASGSIVLAGVAGGGVLPPPVLNGPASSFGTQGVPFSYTITATNDPTSFDATGLPDGLLVNVTTGVISGTPLVAGDFSVTLSATNASGPGSASLSLTINPPSVTGLYQTDFTAFAPGVGTVVDSDGWLGEPDAHGIFNAFAGRGQGMYVGFDDTYAFDSAFFWRPLTYDPLSSGSPIVRFTSEIRIQDSTNSNYDDFGFQFYNIDGDYLASIVFDNSNNRIYLDDDSGPSYTDTGKTFTNAAVAHFVIEVDYANNTWTASLNGVQIFVPRPFHQGGKPLDLGDVTLYWGVQDPGNPGDNYLAVDNFSVTALRGVTTTFTSAAGLAVPSSGTATPYPSTIGVSGLEGQFIGLSVRLDGVSHTFSDDLDLLLVSPGGQAVVLMSDAGGTEDLVNHQVIFDDLAPTGLPTGNVATHTARYRPTNFSEDAADAFPASAPAGPYATTLSALYGGNPNGTWKLFVVDDNTGDSGAIASWSLEITMEGSLGQNFAGWRANFFTVVEITAGLGDPTADPDFDGIVNLMEYALNLQPRISDINSPNLPRSAIETIGGVRSLSFQYIRDLSRSGIVYGVEISGDLGTWSAFTGQDILLDQTGTIETRKAYLPIIDPRKMLRLAVRQ